MAKRKHHAKKTSHKKRRKSGTKKKRRTNKIPLPILQKRLARLSNIVKARGG